MANTLEMSKEETGRKSENSRYTSKKQMNLVFEHVGTNFFPLTARDLSSPSMLRNPFF